MRGSCLGAGTHCPSMKVPPKRKGNGVVSVLRVTLGASMKVPPKRKGNSTRQCSRKELQPCLNESPSEKEGKSAVIVNFVAHLEPQ